MCLTRLGAQSVYAAHAVGAGRILGVSGIVGGLLRGDMSAWRLAWMGGLASGALALTVLHPAAFPTLPDSYSLLRAGSAGEWGEKGTGAGKELLILFARRARHF